MYIICGRGGILSVLLGLAYFGVVFCFKALLLLVIMAVAAVLFILGLAGYGPYRRVSLRPARRPGHISRKRMEKHLEYVSTSVRAAQGSNRR